MVEVAHSLTLIINANVFHCPNLRSCSFAQNGLRLLIEFVPIIYYSSFFKIIFWKAKLQKTFNFLQVLWKGIGHLFSEGLFLWHLLVFPSFCMLVLILNCNRGIFFLMLDWFKFIDFPVINVLADLWKYTFTGYYDDF